MKQLTIFEIFAESALSKDFFVIENFNHLHCFVRVSLLLLLLLLLLLVVVAAVVVVVVVLVLIYLLLH